MNLDGLKTCEMERRVRPGKPAAPWCG